MTQPVASRISQADRPGVLRLADNAGGAGAALRLHMQRHGPLILIAGLLGLAWCMIRLGVLPHPLDMADYLYLSQYEGNAVLLAQHVLAYVGLSALCLRWAGQYVRGSGAEGE